MVNNLNLAECVVVPCQWNKDCFVRRGVRVPIYVVPLGVNGEVFDCAPMPLPWDSPVTVFAAAGRTAHGRDRKGLDGVIRAFRAAFPYDPDVRLNIKCYPDCQLLSTDDKRIRLIRHHLPVQAVAKFLKGAHCFVSAACGEGWGLWQHQAMAMGRPVIGPAYGGLAEFMGPHNSFLVHYWERPCSEDWGGKWAIPDLGAMVKQMQVVHSDHDLCGILGVRAFETVHGFTWENSCEQLLGLLADCGALDVDVKRRVFYKPAINQYDYTPPRQLTVEQQCQAFGFECEDVTPARSKEHWWCNPSVVNMGGMERWFYRQCWNHPEKGLQSRIFFGDKETGVSVALNGCAGDAYEDPRAFVWGERVGLGYTKVTRHGRPTQEVAELDGNLVAAAVSCLHVDFGGNGVSSLESSAPEKNWIWFVHEGVLHFVYWLEPMKVVKVVGGKAVEVYESNKHYEGWRHGVRHGGGSPTRIGDEYFGFCHSLMPWYGRDRSRYAISAYAFEAKPPFALTRLSKVPFLFGSDNWVENPNNVVICGGAVLKDDMWTLALGVRDDTCLKVKVPHRFVLKGMVQL